jgi:ribose transport system substrate-binding protein
MLPGRHSLHATATIAAVAVGVAACGGSSSSPVTGGDAKVDTRIEAKSSGCGSFPRPAPQDPDGVVAALPKRYQETYAGYNGGTIRKSPWANWRPSHPPPYKVAIDWALLTNDYQSRGLEILKEELEKNPDIGEVVERSLTSVNVPQQLQQYAALVREKPDIIISEPLQAEAWRGAVDRAAADGIPTIVYQGAIPTPNAVNVQSNNYIAAAETAAGAAQLLGGKGSILLLHGFPTVDVDRQEFAGFKAVLERCPDLKVAGETLGAFATATAKQQTLKFLATHPQKIDGVFQTALMSTGAMSAFEQTGRPMPIVTDIAAQKGSLGYWRQNRDSYSGVGAGLGAAPISLAVADVVGRMLAGSGPKLTDITDVLPLITDENLDEWAEPSWDLRTPGQAEGPENEHLTPEYLDPLFNEPAGR